MEKETLCLEDMPGTIYFLSTTVGVSQKTSIRFYFL